VTTYGEKVAIRARRGVVLASGSFAYNAELVEQHVPALSGRPGSAIEEHDGQAMRAAQWVGADVAHMNNCEVAIHADPGLMARSLVINGLGQRFINEDTYPGRIGVATALQQRNQALIVADQRAVDEAMAAPKATRMIPPPSWVSDDIAELEADAGLPQGSLAATLEAYNRHAAAGADPLFHKAAQWLRPLEGPIGIFDVRGQTSGFPLGGLRTSVDGAVLDVDGDAIPGLFAAGRTTLGIAASNYASGCSLGDGSFFGRRAGRAASTG
jgi:3-oxo-5alpha-steroid 4-dehydrogenase